MAVPGENRSVLPAPAITMAVTPGRRQRPWRAARAHPSACVGGAIILVMVTAAVMAPLIAPDGPLQITSERLEGPGRDHLLGTDELGRDVLSRVLHGARTSLGWAAVAGILVVTIGLFFGVVAGYFGGMVDAVIMRVVDIILALPGLVVAFAIAGLFEPSLGAVLLGIISVWWVGFARIVRTMVVSLRERDFMGAARALGANGRRIVFRHVLPNIIPSVVVLTTLRMGRLILAIAGLSFLGLGAQPPTPEWGAMLNDARPYFPSYPHLFLAPGLAITIVAVGLNLLGDGLRDLLDPRVAPGADSSRGQSGQL